jgi:hypothetical protein
MVFYLFLASELALGSCTRVFEQPAPEKYAPREFGEKESTGVSSEDINLCQRDQSLAAMESATIKRKTIYPYPKHCGQRRNRHPRHLIGAAR